MAADDFHIDSLADYLHLMPQQVARLADRGRLPGRKVGGRWRFSRAEIHHWLEDRIGLSEEEELVDVEGVLRRAGAGLGGEEEIVIAELLPEEAIAIPLLARTRGAVFEAMIDLATRTGWLWDPAKMLEAVRAREEMYPTTLDNGVALLHPRRPMPKILAQPMLALGCTTTGIPFSGGTVGGLTDVFFLICSVSDRGHLQTLARLSRTLATPGFLAALRQADGAREAHRLLVEIEQGLGNR